MRILIIDRDSDRRRELTDELVLRTDVPVHITDVASVREVLPTSEPSFDVALLSLSAADDVRAAARSVAERLPDLPIVVLGGRVAATDPTTMVDYGVQDHVARHCSECTVSPRLVKALRWAVERSRLLRRIARLQAESERRALHDGLTSLPNRQLLCDRLEHLRAQAVRRKGAFALLFVDLDDFKLVNDRHGHLAGDRVLVEVARRVVECLRESDTCARWSGDELVVLLDGVRDPAGAREVAAKIRRAVARPVALPGGARVVPTVSVGTALWPRDGVTGEALLRAADESMYREKRRGAQPDAPRVFRSRAQ